VAAAFGRVAALAEWATDVAASDDAASDDALGGLIAREDDDHRRVAGGGSSSSDGPDESLFGGGENVTAVETVGFEGTSPVGVLARGIT
jgi:hypothetical protein